MPAEVQKQLPGIDGECTPESVGRLLREIRSDPDALVTYDYVQAEEPGAEPRDITVRELADELLHSDVCNRAQRRRIEAALGV